MGTEGDRRRRAEQLDRAINEHRKTLRLKWNDLAALAGMTYGNLHKIRTGQITVSEDAAYGIEEALRWEHGSVETVLAGGSPALLAEPPDAGALPDLRDDTERRLWALPDVSEDERWVFIHTHRATQRAMKRPRSA